MSSIHSKDTKPEMIVRRGLWKRGFRYRLNYKRLPGHPDIVLRKYRTCIFVNGCFWHGHYVDVNKMESSNCCRLPRTNKEFWVNKITRNKERDKEEQKKLASMGWHCITIWECELKPKLREQTLDSLAYTLNHIWLQDLKKLHPLTPSPKGKAESYGGRSKMYQQLEEDNGMLMAAEEEEKYNGK
ncbi:MAG: DNA mismatch endonuclease Vsr [Bacteroidaceae bacterium]|nr:DNA mismatch endonuclease Vsr [Bacteroidaceae bacterium]